MMVLATKKGHLILDIRYVVYLLGGWINQKIHVVVREGRQYSNLDGAPVINHPLLFYLSLLSLLFLSIFFPSLFFLFTFPFLHSRG